MKKNAFMTGLLLLVCGYMPSALAQKSSVAPASDAAAQGEMPTMWLSLMVSDSKQQMSNAVGVSEVEAKLRAKKDCGQEDCQLLLSMPLTPPACMAVVAVEAPRAGVRGIFAANARDTGSAESDAMAQCKKTGGRGCTVKVSNCF